MNRPWGKGQSPPYGQAVRGGNERPYRLNEAGSAPQGLSGPLCRDPETCKNIKIVTCYLQLKTGETYQSVKALSCPSADSNTNDYYATKDYSGDMTRGHTYRIKATFDADGHKITKYSGPIDW